MLSASSNFKWLSVGVLSATSGRVPVCSIVGVIRIVFAGAFGVTAEGKKENPLLGLRVGA
jgi:hypothetical protein